MRASTRTPGPATPAAIRPSQASRVTWLATAHWSHHAPVTEACLARVEFTDAERAEYVASDGYSLPSREAECPACGRKLALALAPLAIEAKPEPKTTMLTKAELKANRAVEIEAAKATAADPLARPFPWKGKYNARPLRDVPRVELSKARAYYGAKTRRDRFTALLAALDAALAAPGNEEEFPKELIDVGPAPWEKS